MSLSSVLIAAVSLTYMAILFAIAFYGERRAALSPKCTAAFLPYALTAQ